MLLCLAARLCLLFLPLLILLPLLLLLISLRILLLLFRLRPPSTWPPALSPGHSGTPPDRLGE